MDLHAPVTRKMEVPGLVTWVQGWGFRKVPLLPGKVPVTPDPKAPGIVQGYLTYKKTQPPRTLPQACA